MQHFQNCKPTSRALAVLMIFIISGLTFNAAAQSPTQGKLTFTVKTVSAGGKYAPRHVLAIWIEDSNGFVKTRKRRANRRSQYLYTWNSASGGNSVDAITGSTLSEHQTHTVSWDCKDVNGNVVPDGDYKIFIEFTSEHAQGPLYSVTFTKGPVCTDITPPDQSYFKNMHVEYSPTIYHHETAAICEGETYEWQNRNLTDQGVYTETLQSVHGCDSIRELELTVNPSFLYQESYSICEGESYNWHNRDLGVQGIYYDSIVTISGCDSIYEMAFDVQLPPGSFDLAGQVEVEESQTYTYTAPENNNVTYIWSIVNGEIISSPANNTAEVRWGTPGQGQLSAFSENNTGCQSDAAMLTVSIGPTGKQEGTLDLLQVYPNPVNDKLVIRNIPGSSAFDLFDITGKKIMKGLLDGTHNEIDVSALENGIYFIRIGNASIHKISKL